MAYLAFILLCAIVSIVVLITLASILKRKILVLDRGFIGTLAVFYALWWLGDALAIQSGFYQYNPKLLLGIWIGAIPLEDHIAGLLVII